MYLDKRQAPTGTPDLRRHALATTLLLLGMIGLAFALRLWRLGDWGFEGDEIFTLRDSLKLRPSNPRPLLYVLNHVLVRPWMALDEWGLRLLPALFGVLALPALYLVGRRLVGTRAALFGTLLLTVNPLHVYHSQYARYWSLVFLLCAVYPFATYLGIRNRNPGVLALGVLTGILAVLAHPVSILLVGGLGVWIAADVLRRDRLVPLWSLKSVRWGGLVILVLGAAMVLWFFPLLRSWMRAHGGGRPTEHLLFLPGRQGVKQIGLLLGYLEGLTVPLVLAGVLGIYLLWRERDRPLGLLLASLLLFPVAFILLLSFRTAVSTTYLLPAAPVVFLGAGVFLDRVAAIEWELRPRWLLPAAMAAFIMAAGAPSLLSQYRDGRRHDFRGVAHWLDDQLAPDDVVFSDQAKVLNHYLPGRQVRRLTADTVQLVESIRVLHDSAPDGVTWIVAPYSARGGHRTNPRLGGFKGWIYDNCQLRNAVGVARLDFRQNELQVYRCPPLPAQVGPSVPALSSPR